MCSGDAPQGSGRLLLEWASGLAEGLRGQGRNRATRRTKETGEQETGPHRHNRGNKARGMRSSEENSWEGEGEEKPGRR